MPDDVSAVPPWFKSYIARGFHLIDYDQKKKGPEGTSALDWTSPERRITSIEQYKPDRNWGCFTGVELSPGKYLVDVDFDWQEGVAVLAKRLLPDTEFGFGRASRPLSHAFFTVSQPIARKSYEDLDKKTTFVELRGATDDGGIGWQTMLPPSIHPSGEEVMLRADGQICHQDNLPRRVQLYAVSCLLLKYLGEREFRHDLRLALAGFLLGEGVSEKETVEIGEAIALATHNDIKDVRFTVRSTSIALKQGEPVKGAGILGKQLGKDESQGRELVKQLRRFLGTQHFEEDKKGKIFANSQRNIRMALEKLGVVLDFNDFSHQMTCIRGHTRTLIEDELWIPLWFEVDEKFHFQPDRNYFLDVMRAEAWKNRHHPVKNYLDSLQWDGISRIDGWLIDYAGAKDSDYVRAVSSLVLIAAVRRVREPGCKFDEMLILESGKQGTNKSTALKTLCPEGEWFSDDLPLGVPSDKVIERTRGKWIIEASELHGNRQKEADHMKSFLSRQVDGPVRLAWDRTPVERARQFIIIGTTNTLTGYLKDSTGARRFWPVAITKFDVNGIQTARDQLWAEAAWREAQGESIRLKEDLWEAAEIEQDERRAVHPWEDMIDTVHAEDGFLDADAVPVTKIWNIIGMEGDKRNNSHAGILGEIMQRKGFTRKARPLIDDPDNPGEKKQVLCWIREVKF